MTPEQDQAKQPRFGFSSKVNFLMFIGTAIVLSIAMVMWALDLYNSSGAAQVDLSRPGYQSIREEASTGTGDDVFDSSGSLDATALDEFDAMYSKHAKRVVDSNSFTSDALTDKSLQYMIDQP